MRELGFPAHPPPSHSRSSKAARKATRRCAAATALGVIACIAWTGCDGPQSGLDPAGKEAAQIARLFWWMTAGAVVIWLLVAGLTVYAVRVPPDDGKPWGQWMIVGGGAVFPTIVLAGLLAYGLAMLPPMLAPPPEGSLRIRVAGEMWWWRVSYQTPDGPVETANEVRLPAGEPVEFLLESSNVIHSFWIPSLGGKRDMIPGRVNRLTLHPERPGIFRGVCAEYCGTSHALMNFYAVVMDQGEFAEWLAKEAQAAAPPAGPLAERGQRLFLTHGCGACHSIRGTPAQGKWGPDLTHAGGRLSLGGGALTNNARMLQRWMREPEKIKPGVHMPAFRMLPDEDLEAMAVYLEGLK